MNNMHNCAVRLSYLVIKSFKKVIWSHSLQTSKCNLIFHSGFSSRSMNVHATGQLISCVSLINSKFEMEEKICQLIIVFKHKYYTRVFKYKIFFLVAQWCKFLLCFFLEVYFFFQPTFLGMF